MQESSAPPIITFLPATLFLMIIGWGGLIPLVIFYPPAIWPRWLFFFLGVLASTGTVLPIVAFLNRRFTSKPPASVGTIMRQALWIGIYFPTLAWLQIPRILTPTLALLIALGLIVIEWLLRLREQSRWKP